ncbi:MAG: ornithine carbamoyltransferase [Deltaproteobacteria bacterium RBG_19FT_COMBO_46_12]|nr:MAG: ornithine carbamoyltransferase [Deltaproteobacteria bacterium RBG_19FT_COMBO_46_12]
MAIQMKGKSLASLYDLKNDEVDHILKTSELLKSQLLRGEEHPLLKSKALAMIFEKPSTRTRVSFETGMWQLGGYALYLNAVDLQLGRGETIADTAQTLSRYVNGIMARVFDHQTILDLVRYSTVPVINGLSDFTHPCQGLADLFTIYEKKGRLSGLKLAYIGDGNNVAHSLLFGCSKVGMNITLACPKGYEPNPEVVSKAKEEGKRSGCKVKVTHDPKEAVQSADIVYTDVWASMGKEKEHEKRMKIFKPYQINLKLVKEAKEDYLFMHCLPAHRGEEVTDEVADSKNSVIFDQAENRLHTQKALMALIM